MNTFFKMIGISLILVTLMPLAFSQTTSSTTSAPTYSPIVVVADYKENYQRIINATVEYVFLYPISNANLMDAARIQVESNASQALPLLVVVRQKKGILSWQIPLLVDSMYFDTLAFNKTSRTLCSTKYYRTQLKEQEEFVTVTISTASHQNILFKLNVTARQDFYLSLGSSRTVSISPSEPIYYAYTFLDQKEKSSSVIVHVQSDNDVCMTFSIQNTSCPVFDLERNVEFSGYWQTVNRQGGITVSHEAYPSGFFVVLVVKGDDTDCVGVPSTSTSRNKVVTLNVIPSIAKHNFVLASTLTLSLILGFCIIYIIGMTISRIKENRRLRRELLDANTLEDANVQLPTSSMEELGPPPCGSIDDDSSLDEDDIDLLADALTDKDVIRTKRVLSVCDLARKDPRILRHKSRLYLYYLGTVAIFYTLPVIQLVMRYQDVLRVTGNQDLCYYNFLCAHPLGLLSDFNHVFSNVGYVLLGLLFIFFTYTREHSETERDKNRCYGIPQHYGLFYAMGTALIMEGVLSGSYHVCPNRSNFQFDTSFMYIITVLCMIKIYQTRHPDINARAPITFGLLAFIIFIGLMGVLNGSVLFWVTFTIIHLLACFLLTIQIYYMGRWKFNRGCLTRIILTCKHDAQSGVKNLFTPLYAGRFVMLVVANLCNVALAVVGNITHEKNFATFLLAVLMSNLILYTLFYIVMKLCHRERILLVPLIYIILSIVFWAAALYFFLHRTISWALTPAQSRHYNKPCELFDFFDTHDIWHFLSAFAMFFSFMVLLTLDDDLIDVHRSEISVF